MKIYLLTKGSYSGYHIVGVFTDKALADEALAQKLGDDIDERDVTETLTLYRHLDVATTITDGVRGKAVERIEVKTEEFDPPNRQKVNSYEVVPYSRPLRVEVRSYGDDEERVRKAHSERVARALADYDVLTAERKAELAERDRQLLPFLNVAIPPAMEISTSDHAVHTGET